MDIFHLGMLSTTTLEWRVYFVQSICYDFLNLLRTVIITAMPYFAERLADSEFQRTFASYLSTACTASNFLFLAHATVTSKRVGASYYI